MTESDPDSTPPETSASGQVTSGQATVHSFDSSSGSGSVITDDGVVIPFSEQAWRHSRLLTLRVGQRLRVSTSGHGPGAHVTALTLATFAP
jgi:2-phospho-L-lactate guanylyltransferase